MLVTSQTCHDGTVGSPGGLSPTRMMYGDSTTWTHVQEFLNSENGLCVHKIAIFVGQSHDNPVDEMDEMG